MMTPQKLNAMKILTEEYKKLANDPSTNFGITVGLLNEDNIFEWRCSMTGPRDSCYKGGIFFLKITFPFDYPNSKPEIVFLTPIYHLNVLYAANQKQPLGHICVNTLNEWKPGDSIIRILPQVFALLNKNNPDSPYDDHLNSRKNEFVNNRPLFNKKAEYFTKKYAYSNDKIIEYKNGWDFTYK